jgi:1-acyl-sn-glycerol-3-phosphate acyltransferase
MFIRSLLFYLLLSCWTIFLGLICLPYLILSSKYLIKPVKLWIKGIFFLLENICKITHEIQGIGYFPKHAVLIASKHQSAFETLALFYYLPKSIFIHKKQLFLIPIFGQYLKKINMISIDRKGGAVTMRKMLKQTKIKTLEGFSIIIFPEGTRKKPGEKPDYKSGFVGIYKAMGTEILPIAVNSGKCWPKHTFVKKSGHIIIKILPLISSSINKKQILKDVEVTIEEATNEIT